MRKELRNYYDIKIWVEVDYGLRLKRGIERDGANMKEKWERDWMPKEDMYISSQEHNPREYSDIIINGNLSGKEKQENFLTI